MKVYSPVIDIRLIKTVRRKQFVTGVDAAHDRYSMLDGINLFDFIGEGGGIQTRKSVREPAGAFSITLADKAHPKLLESLYALIEPMDVVEIRMRHGAGTYHEDSASAEAFSKLNAESDALHAEYMAAKDKADAFVDQGLHAYSQYEETGNQQYLEQAKAYRQRAVDAYDAADKKYKPLIEAMDRKLRDAGKKVFKSSAPKLVMRGIVSNVSRSETVAGGKPVRTVVITGQDYGKVLQTLQLYYLSNSVVGVDVLSEFNFFQKYADASDAKIKSASDFVRDVVRKVLNPYLSRMLGLAQGASIGVNVAKEFIAVPSIAGEISPDSVCSYVNVSLDAMLRSALDVGAFNEMYVEDTETAVRLVVRPIPFRRAGTNEYIQAGASADEVVIPSEDVVALNVSRCDSGVYNYYWVVDNRWSMLNNEAAKSFAQYGEAGSYMMMDVENCAAATYGFRKLEVPIVLGGEGFTNSDAISEKAMPTETRKLASWMDSRRATLADLNKDNILFESGTIRIRGNESIRAGMYVTISRGNGVKSSYYVVAVSHEFVPFEGFYSTLNVERGTGFVERGRLAEAVYRREIDGRGVV